MQRNWRILDTGLRAAAQNIALDRALLEARRANEIPTTLRFFRCTPSALLGLQQSAAHELVAAYCETHHISIQRRVTGGVAVYMDPRQLGWALYADREDLGGTDLRTASKHLSHAVAAAVSALGCDARYRRYDEIEVDGRTIGGCGGATDGDAVLFFGWIFGAVDFDALCSAVRMPVEHAPAHLRAAVAERIVDISSVCGGEPDLRAIRDNIAEAIGNAYDVEFADADVGMSEEHRYRAVLPQIEARDWVDLVARPAGAAPRLEALARVGGSMLRVQLIADLDTETLKRVWFGGDVVFNPKRTKYDLESELRDVPFARVTPKLEWFFASRPKSMVGVAAADLASLIARAIGRPVVGMNLR
jgi:lipoate-protein ligase A